MKAPAFKLDEFKDCYIEVNKVWNLKFKSWETDFGEILAIHHELFDLNGMKYFNLKYKVLNYIY